MAISDSTRAVLDYLKQNYGAPAQTRAEIAKALNYDSPNGTRSVTGAISGLSNKGLIDQIEVMGANGKPERRVSLNVNGLDFDLDANEALMNAAKEAKKAAAKAAKGASAE